MGAPRCGSEHYPAGYVEPYPEFYARLKTLAERTAEGLHEIQADYRREGLAGGESRQFAVCAEQAGAFWSRFAGTMDTLARLARKELAAEPFTSEDRRFLKETVSLKLHDLSGCDVGHVGRGLQRLVLPAPLSGRQVH